jgi:magnesium transporter
VTAIVGNVLISFALNIQRYAHLRIVRKSNNARKASRARRKQLPKQSPNGLCDYGTTQQEDVTQERARFNVTGSGPGQRSDKSTQAGDDGVDDTHPMYSSYESESTLTGSEKADGADDDGRMSYLKSPYWWLGITLMTTGEAGNFLAYGFAPASIVSPLGVVALIVNCVIAPIMLKERFRQRDFWGVVVAIGGVVTVVLSAKQSETKIGPDDLWANIKRWEFLLYVGITTLLIIVLMYASSEYGSRSILINLGLVGLVGGYTVLSTKGVASLLSDSLFRAFTFLITYFLILILVLSALMQIHYLNRALQDFDATQVIPTQYVLFTLSVIIGSTVLFRDFEAATLDRVGKFVGGCLLTFFGVYLITSGRERGDSYEADDFSDDEEGIRLIDEEAEYADERTPLHREPFNAQLDRPPVTPNQDLSRRHSPPGSPSIPLTPDPTTSSTSLNLPRLSSTDLDEVPSPVPQSQPDIFKTPQLTRLLSNFEPSTPYYTSSPILQHKRNESSAADAQTPTRANKRTGSPPRPDPSIAARPHVTPHSLARAARGSLSLLIPGTLLPTISSSLSAIVADSVLHGEGSPRQQRASLKRNRSLRAGHGINTNGTPTEGDRRPSVNLDGELSRMGTRRTLPDLNVSEVVEEDGSVSRKESRLRAMSDSLGGLIGGTGRGKMRIDLDRSDDEGGGSGGGGGRAGVRGPSREAPT